MGVSCANLRWVALAFACGAESAPLLAQVQSARTDTGQIIVIGRAQPDLFAGIVTESELGETDIAAYGFDTVGDLIAEVGREADQGEDGPIILINGQPTAGFADVADLPTEALSRIQILPRGAGVRVGQGANRRVVNIVIKPDLRQVTGSAGARLTTRGGGGALDGEANLLRLDDGNRASLVLRARRVEALRESERGIVTDTLGPPFDLVGNIISAGGTGSPIDPALSALAGFPVLVAGVPGGVANPALSQFVASANRPNVSDLGAYRTLQSAGETYSANGNLTRRLDAVSTFSLTGRAERTVSRSLTGAASGVFTIPAQSRFSPFGNGVVLARAFGDPLGQTVRSKALSANATLNTRIGRYAVSVLATLDHRVATTRTDRDYDTAAIAAGIANGAINPFAPFGQQAIGAVRTDTSRLRADSGQIQAIVNGPLLTLPAGPATFSLRAGTRREASTSRSAGRSFNVARAFERSEHSAQLGFTLPLTGGGLWPGLGPLTLDLATGVRAVRRVGTLHAHSGALTWNPFSAANFRLAYSSEETAPPASALNDPLVIVDNVRAFDFVRQETVAVRFITGGNPALPAQRLRRLVAGTTIRPFGGSDLSLSAEYQRLTGRDAFAALPPADARVQLAFPDRYQRDAQGRLVQIDARPITYARDREELVRWGIDLRRTIGGAVSAAEAEGGEPAPGITAGRGWRLNFTADHTWTLTKTRLVRNGLPIIDLLDGGAVGYAGGQARHLVRATGAVYHAGIGLQLSADYRGPSTIAAGTTAAPDPIRFAGRTTVDTRMFINLGPQFPNSALAKGARFTLSIDNLFDTRQRVTDSNGATPLRYQPFLIDPLGRTVMLSLRKVF